jgi:hypothetical protein
MLIFRRSNCIVTASGIVILRKQLFSAPVESGLLSGLNRCTEWRVDKWNGQKGTGKIKDREGGKLERDNGREEGKGQE